jgi:tripartite-type tricarboxylate transporter receptor subunit TctC
MLNHQNNHLATYFTSLIGAAGLAFTVFAAPFPASAQSSLKGQTVNLVIGFPPGSSDDLGMRQLKPFLESHLPGKPTVAIINKPGAGGILAVNSFYQTAKGDGKTIGMFTGVTLKVAIKDKSVRFDINKMHLLGIQPTNQVTLLHKDTGVKTPADLLKVKKALLVGTSSKRAAPFTANVSFFNMLGIPHKDLTGYRGQGELLQAARAKELNVVPLAWVRYMANKEQLKKEGLLTAIYQRGYLQGDGSVVPEPALGVPTQHELIKRFAPDKVESAEYKAMTTFVGIFATGRSFWLPPSAPEDVRSMWRKALAATYGDPKYRALMKKRTKMDVVFHDPKNGRNLLNTVIDSFQDPVIRKVIDQIMAK